MSRRPIRTEDLMTDTQRLEATDDAGLLREARRSSAAFRVLYDRHAARIHAFHLRRTGDRDAAHDLTAETFAQAWFFRERYVDHREGTIAPWLFGIARHVLAASVRQRRLERQASDRLHLEAASGAVAVDDVWLAGLDEDLAAAIQDLPDGQRRAVELRVLADQAYDDVARELDCTPATARVRVHRGLATIRRRLTADPTITTDLPEGADR
jgi:RNA polymerase sigma-70 factor (ECF subfamily)